MSAATIPADPERADITAWLAVIAGSLGAFMATLDISIVNASLPTIQGEIGATPSEGTWIGTSYLVAEIIVTPLTAWFARMLGLRRFLLIAAVLFTGFSMMCGLANDLTMMIIGRTGQGLAGGTLIPTALTIVAIRLPPRQQAIGISLFGVTVLFGPLSGPLIGGWITETFSWHYAFFINLPICITLIILLIVGLPKVKGDWHELWNADWYGIAGMVLGLGALTVLLEEGHREQWFESALIIRLAIVSTIGFAMIIWSQFRASRPVIRLALLRERSLAASVVIMMMMGALLFGTSFAIPQFLALVAGYNALQAGEVVFVSGLTGALLMIAYPIISEKMDHRISVALGCAMIALGCLLNAHLTSASVGDTFVVTQLLFGLGASLTTLSLQQVTIASVPPADAGDASGLYMAARNLGGSVGLAVMATFQDQRIEIHRWQLHSLLGANDIDVQQALSAMALQFGGGPDGLEAAYRMMDSQILRDALVMSFNDIFLMLAIGTMAVMPLAIFLRRAKPGTFAVMH